jgi:alpha-beta hydrolase superfamily lysophospholipase
MNMEGWSAFLFDFTGHGKSQGLRSLVNLRVWAYNLRDALTTLQKKGYGPFAVVGLGIGASAALLAAAHDQRIESAVILSTPMILQPSLAERVAYGLASGAAKIKKAIFKRPLTLSRVNELKEMRFLFDEVANEQYVSNERMQQAYAAVPVPDSLDSVWMDISEAVQKISLPVLIIHSKEDKIVPTNQSSKILTLLKGLKEIKIIEGSGHALHLDQKKEEVFRLILDWINGHRKEK